MSESSDIPDNCPKCGAKMEKGYVTANSPAIFWSIEKTKRSTWDSELIAGKRVGLSNANMSGFRCSNCKLVLFSYEKEGE